MKNQKQSQNNASKNNKNIPGRVCVKNAQRTEPSISADDAKKDYARIVSWWQNLSRTKRLYELNDFAEEFCYHSAKVERADLTYAEALEVYNHDTVTNYTGDIRSLISVLNQRSALWWMAEKIIAQAPLDEEFILTLHRTLVYHTLSNRQLMDGERPGKYKVCDYFVRETREVGAAADECPKLTRELLAEVQEAMGHLDAEKALTVAAYLHVQLVVIHPFSEGTGRVARDLANYVLLASGYPPAIVFEDDKEGYFDALEIFDETGDLEPFKNFLRACICRTWGSRV